MSFQWNDKEPIYLQLRDQIRNMILIGDLIEGEPLPSVRQVASDYKLNPLTVSKAWQYLVDEELVEKKRGLGMFVRKNARSKLLEADQVKFMKVEWPKVKVKIKNLNLDVSELIQSLEKIREA